MQQENWRVGGCAETIDEAVNFGPCLEALRISKKDLQNEADTAALTLTVDSLQPHEIMKLA